jgi:hypothetical protein
LENGTIAIVRKKPPGILVLPERKKDMTILWNVTSSYAGYGLHLHCLGATVGGKVSELMTGSAEFWRL